MESASAKQRSSCLRVRHRGMEGFARHGVVEKDVSLTGDAPQKSAAKGDSLRYQVGESSYTDSDRNVSGHVE